MNIVLGADGHVGSATATTLLEADAPVTVVLHHDTHATRWRRRGAEVAVVDVADTDVLREVLRSGSRAFLLNPPADPSTDTDVEEHRTAMSIAAAVEGAGLEKVVAASTYGARAGERIGDLSVLHDFEVALGGGSTPVAVNRGAYYLSNWDPMVTSAREDGVISSMLPADVVLPMVAPADLGAHAARRLLDGPDDTGLQHVEGPERHSPADVARAFADVLGHPVSVAVVEADQWEETFLGMGFSPAAADAYARMTAVTVEGDLDLPVDPVRGSTTLAEHVAALVRSTDGDGPGPT